jgi:hypothetical protein
LRPEVAESLFVMHQLTGNPVYREWSWKIFKGIDNNCKVAYGYGSYVDVTLKGSSPLDKQQSFFLAETLKYLYLTQSPDHNVSLKTYVLNTEAHPLMILPLSHRDLYQNTELHQSLNAGFPSDGMHRRSTKWVDHVLKAPSDHVTGTIHDSSALIDGTFSDDFTDEELRLSDEYGDAIVCCVLFSDVCSRQ